MNTKKQLEDLPQIIFDLERQLLEGECDNQDNSISLKNRELKELLLITQEMLDDKKKFPNEVSRKSELKIRLEENEGFQELKKKIEETKYKLSELRITIDFKKRLFRSCESLARLE